MEGVSREAQMSIAASSMFPGFRFCPTDEELISYYLRKKMDGHQESVQVISEVELCKYEPWDLPAKSFIQSDNEWFFFSPRGRKYPKGSQSKRATECGYWKATGKERNVKSGSNVIGTKRTLVFHLGRAPKGERTEWIMHEYCINEKSQDSLVICRLKKNTEFRLGDSSNRASSSQRHPVGCSSKRDSCSYGSPSMEQIDSVSEPNQRPVSEATLAVSSGQPKERYEEDCYAEILKDDIIKLDESSISVEGHTRPQDPIQMHPSPQGTSQRRIRLRVGNSKHSPAVVRFPCTMHSSKSTFFARITISLVVFPFFVFTLTVLYFLSLVGGNKQKVERERNIELQFCSRVTLVSIAGKESPIFQHCVTRFVPNSVHNLLFPLSPNLPLGTRRYLSIMNLGLPRSHPSFEWKQQLVADVDSNPSVSQKQHQISKAGETVKEKIILVQEKNIRRLNELVRHLQEQLQQCRGRNGTINGTVSPLAERILELERQQILED
ncbi:hypothetical protein JHK82_034329 [Glycine max]|uniref:NAC domain-containing protein n=1 Tax=Glycine max TaxID=3847 RepID=A0A0R0HGS9_SOYBN|nr:hypothetical protein JHK85_035037 [Glycine max]KAG4986706.1 hypothetical protein JHK86_034397 [Glycine max]KAG5119909.1 hypothetical protein JHK82_034329 [Glycine max]